ncbi:MAG: MBL fold metallo-hydrolase [Acidobacteria bacterium]|nr:MBL fold metallo-hydrolase [Acidobacteriota bacterium]
MPASNIRSLSIQSFTSSEPGAWSNSYLVSGKTEAILFDVFMLRSDALKIAEGIEKSGKTLTAVMISHAHPDHFMSLEVITERFPRLQVVSTANVVADIQADGPWMFSMLQNKLGEHGPKKLVVPDVLTRPMLNVDGFEFEVVEFGECEAKHIAALHIPELSTLLTADLVYNKAHLYLQERHLESWLTRLDELELFAEGKVTTFHPGHGSAGDANLIDQTRQYLQDFAEAVQSGDASTTEKQILMKYPDYHARQFLSAFSIPAFFPPAKEGTSA